MSHIFDGIASFFSTLEQTYKIGYEITSGVFVGLFLLVVLFAFIATSRSYEAKLIKAIDMLNGYFVNNPKITEDNLVLFNQIMRHKKVPKLLRKHWQQFMLYREHNASYYMSFENCVVIPLRNSKFKRDRLIMNLFAYILAGFAFVFNTYLVKEGLELSAMMQALFFAPVLILIINYICSIVLNLKENAIINDLNQNYQYFETNIDKATKTLPEFVDYEILFEKQEIKKGIPILYQYLQKRAEEEQRELELARLKNVEHEKFNFDEAGLAGSLVLERAMQEAENYIAERKKYGQDIEQINSEITQEDMNYREITKEYNRQMQVSKESFANFKQQLEQASSTIEANYLKKQQQQELDRQRNLERDFDTATDRHKKVIESYQAELDSIDNFIAESRKSLQDAMMAEFATYSGKVYDEAKKVVDEREKDKYAKTKQEIKNLEEQLYAKNKELEAIYNNGGKLPETEEVEEVVKPKEKQNVKFVEETEVSKPIEDVNNEVEEQSAMEEQQVQDTTEHSEENSYTEMNENLFEENKETTEDNSDFNWNFDSYKTETNEDSAWNFSTEEKPEETKDETSESFGTMSLSEFDKQENNSEETGEYQSYSDYLKQENLDSFKLDNEEENHSSTEEENIPSEQEKSDDDFSWFKESNEKSTVQEDESEKQGVNVDEESLENKEDADDDFEWFDEFLKESEGTEDDEDEEQEGQEGKTIEIDNEPAKVAIAKDVDAEDNSEEKIEAVAKKRPGRPRKVVTTVEEKPKGKPGRPKKVVVESETNTSGKKRGRPRKEVVVDAEPKRKPGRPKKTDNNSNKLNVVAENSKPKARRGRPKKVVTNVEVKEEKRGRGRPKKKKAGRPRKVVEELKVEDKPKKQVGRPKKSTTAKENTSVKRGRGRPKKSKAGRPAKMDINNVDADIDLEAYLKVIDNAIAEENAKIKKTQRALENNANIKTKKKK